MKIIYRSKNSGKLTNLLYYCGMSNKSDKRIPATKTHEEMITEWMTDPAFKAEYEALEDEYQLLREMLRARKDSALTHFIPVSGSFPTR